jgi:tyrosyl-tRNA synthetase
MFGKIMSMNDEEMTTYFEIFTEEDMEAAKELIKNDPRDAKVKLAKHIVTWLHSADDAEKAYQDFVTKFVKHEVPEEMPEFSVGESSIGILNLITKTCGFASSNGDARRMVEQGGVSLDGEKITDPKTEVELSDTPQVLKVGKRKFGKVSL